MKDATAPVKIYRKDYLPPKFMVDEVSLTFDIGAASTRVTASSKFRRTTSGNDPLVLFGADLELQSIKIDNKKLSTDRWQIEDESLTIAEVPDRFSLETVCVIHPDRNSGLEGLYQSGDFLLTQCEAEGFRKITWFPDRPDVMARYRVQINADKEKFPVLLSNGNLLDQGDLPNGQHFVLWEDPFPKPSYLFALVAGDLDCVKDTFTTQEGQEVVLRIYVEAENIDKVNHAMASLKNCMAWDERRFDLSYDLGIYNIVATNDFNMGAMENKSLNIFNSKYVLAEPETATDADYQAIEAVIGHEYFHNWTGNRITCRDWFQLSLKEGLTVFRDQEFSSDMQSRAIKRIEDVRMLRSHQFSEDSGPMAHPVRPDSFVEINNFYTMTIYEKGAEVVRMYHTLLGESGFQRGMQLYIERHDGQAVTCDDFRQAMADANEVSLDQFERWYSQAGTPVVTVQTHYDAANRNYHIKLSQHTPETPGQSEKLPLQIPVRLGLIDTQGDDLPLNPQSGSMIGGGNVIELCAADQEFVFSGIESAPVLSLFRGFSAPVKVVYRRSRDELAFLMVHDNDSFNRWDAAQQLATDVILELVEQPDRAISTQYLASCSALLEDQETDPALLAAALTMPDENTLAGLQYDQRKSVDVDAIHRARKRLRQAIAAHCEEQLQSRFLELQESGGYQLVAEAISRRSLRNLCLAYLVAGGQTSEAERQFRSATNMTDSFAALRALLHENMPAGEEALNAFYQRWQREQLVIDKWLALQASNPSEGCIDRITELLDHPAFSLRNPNKVRSLIGVFAMSNPIHFHAADGGGYAWLAERIMEVDALNPQVAARLSRGFDPWRRYDLSRQEKAQLQLKRLEQAQLSADTAEVIGRALA